MKTDPTKVSVSGGSAVGGWDHLKVLIVAKAAGITNLRNIKYVAFQGGGEAVTQLIGGHVQAFSGDISEVLGFMQSGDLRVLAVLAPERLPGDLGKICRPPRSRASTRRRQLARLLRPGQDVGRRL